MEVQQNQQQLELDGINQLCRVVARLIELGLDSLEAKPEPGTYTDLQPLTEVAMKLDIHRSTIHGWESRGLINIDRTGNKNRVRFSEAERILNGGQAKDGS